MKKKPLNNSNEKNEFSVGRMKRKQQMESTK